jgi:SprT protein
VVSPIGQEQRAQVLAQTEHYIREAERIYHRPFDRIPVLFDLKGQTAGMFKLAGQRRWIRFNPWIFGKYFDENLRDTVPHEVAHYIAHEVYRGRTGKPHGPRWQRVMAHFGADPGVTFDLDLEGIPQRRQRTHPYHCGCQGHEVSTTRHNRILRGTGRYYCRACNGELVYSR